jgi:hypothetical protein
MNETLAAVLSLPNGTTAANQSVAPRILVSVNRRGVDQEIKGQARSRDPADWKIDIARRAALVEIKRIREIDPWRRGISRHRNREAKQIVADTIFHRERGLGGGQTPGKTKRSAHGS